jgi:hypothetical protein
MTGLAPIVRLARQTFPLTDLGNSRLLVSEHVEDIRFAAGSAG